MKKLRSLIVLGALLLAACGGSGVGASGSDVAATVDGTDVTVAEVEALIDPEDGTISRQDFATFLAAAIQWEIFFDAAEADYGVTVTDEEVDAKAEELVTQLAAGNQTREAFLAERGITEEFLLNIARQTAVDVKIRDALREDVANPTQEELDEARQAARAGLTNACVSHILVETEVEAQTVLDRLAQGEEFGELATDLSTDTGSAANNGILPCSTLEQYVAPFRNAAMEATVGEVHPVPVQSQFGYHVILVTDRTDADESALPSDDDLTTTVQDAAILADLQEWFTGVMEGASVTVDEQFGTWTPNPPSVTPPSEGSSTTLPSDGSTPTTGG